MFDKLRQSLKGPEPLYKKTQREMSERHEATEQKFQADELERQRSMATRREEAEARDIEQAQKDLREIPKKLADLEVRIKQLRSNAQGNRNLAYDAQFKSAGDKGSYEQQAIVQDGTADALEKGEKLTLEVKLDKARRLLESRGLLSSEVK